jgi:CubicO group peptidase (beta-lactamase class C family)
LCTSAGSAELCLEKEGMVIAIAKIHICASPQIRILAQLLAIIKMKILIFFLLGMFSNVQGQELTEYLIFDKICAEANITGAVFSELDSMEIVGLRTFGFRNSETKEVVTSATLFEAASLSKPVFSTLVFRLSENEIINLDKPLIQYLPFEAVSDPRLREVTARHVLMHTSGLPNWTNKTDNVKLKFAPGSKFSYSGEGYLYLQRVIERITQKPIDELMMEYVFKPYNMTNSSFSFNDSLGNYAKPHDKNGNTLEKKLTGTSTSAASSLHSTIEDYSKFVIKFISDTTIFQKSIQVDKKMNLSWALGAGFEVQGSDTLVWHWGNNWNTFRSVFVYSLEKQKGYVLFTNSENGHRILQELNKLVFDQELQFPKWLGYKQITIANSR